MSNATAAANRVWQLPWFQPEVAPFLQNAFSNPTLKLYVSAEQFKLAQRELTVDLRRFPHYRKLVIDEPDVARALILLQVRANGQTRKISGTPAYLHTCEIAEDFLSWTPHVIRSRKQKREAGILITQHDGIEDFGITSTCIEQLFGGEARKRVQHVTCPPPEALALEFVDITRSYMPVPEGIKLWSMKIELNKLKTMRRGVYDSLRSDLKTAHKGKISEEYSLIECIYRGIDNAHSFRSYAEDINNRKLVVDRGRQIELPKNVKSIPLAELTHVIDARSKCHDAILTRMQTLRQEATDKLKPQRDIHDIELAAGIVQNYFDKQLGQLKKAMRHPMVAEAKPLRRMALIAKRAATPLIF